MKRISQLDTQSPVTKINGKRCQTASAFGHMGVSKSGEPQPYCPLLPWPQLVPNISYFEMCGPLDKHVLTLKGGPCEAADLT